jgi:hypothetical protein
MEHNYFSNSAETSEVECSPLPETTAEEAEVALLDASKKISNAPPQVLLFLFNFSWMYF